MLRPSCVNYVCRLANLFYLLRKHCMRTSRMKLGFNDGTRALLSACAATSCPWDHQLVFSHCALYSRALFLNGITRN